MGMAGVGRQRTEESYDKNYIRKTLMELLMLANGKPILFRDIIHRESQGSGNRGYCTHLTLHFQGQPLNNTFVLTQHVMIKGLRGAIARFFERKPATGKAKSNRSAIYLLAYPELYTAKGNVRCGLRLAFEVMDRPYCIEWDPNFLDEASKLAYIPPSEKFLIWPDPYQNLDS